MTSRATCTTIPRLTSQFRPRAEAAQFKARIAATYRSHAELVPELNLEKN
jgi:hypothetical protein